MMSNPRKPSLAQSVEHGTVVKAADIPGSPVQARNGGVCFFTAPPVSTPAFLYLFIGKFAQRSNMTKTKMVTEPNELFDLLSSKKFVVGDARLVNDDTVEVQYCNAEDFEEPDSKTNVVIAAFTTAYARLKLYDLPRSITETGSLLRYGFGDLRARTR